MADKQQTPLPIVKSLSKIGKNSAIVDYRRSKRNRTRRLRRKRSKLRVRQNLRIGRITKSLRQSVHVLDISGMDKPGKYEPSLADVAQWQNQHQIAYWKSRAISLEYENRMLQQHIKKVYAKQFDENAETRQDSMELEENTHKEIQLIPQWQSVEEDDEYAKAPDEQVGKSHQDEMKLLYGKMSPKINGMETAVQLNYDFQMDKFNPPFWPNIPLKL